MKRLIIISILLVFPVIVYGKGGKDRDIINIKPLKNTTSRYWVADLWCDLSYTFYPDTYLIKSNFLLQNGTSLYLEDFELASQFYDIGIKAEVYNNHIKNFKYTIGLNYSNGRFFDERQPGRLLSHWVDMELGIRMQYLSLGFNCSTLLHCSSKNAYDSGLFKYTYCYNTIVPGGYLGLHLEFPRVMLNLKANFGMHKIDHDKIFALSGDSNRYQTPITLSIKLLYKFSSTDRVDNNIK